MFFNYGATPVLVENLRLRLDGGGEPLAFNAVADWMGSDVGRRFATQFPVRQREAVALVCQFQREGGGLLFEARRYAVTLEGLWGRRKRWRRLVGFDLNVTGADLPSINKQLIVRDNWKSSDSPI